MKTMEVIAMDDNSVLSAVIMLERIIQRLNFDSRDTISIADLKSTSDQLGQVLKQLKNCKDVMIMTPIVEVITLIEETLKTGGVIESDAAMKQILADKLTEAMHHLYLFAGKFYIENNFTWAMTKTFVLRNIVDTCVANGIYFGFDKEV